MRQDVYTEEVLLKCQAMKICGLWAREPKIRPRAWIANFELEDREIAALLLDNFIYYNAEHTDALLLSAYNSIASIDICKDSDAIKELINNSVFTIVTGENPNDSDSGYHFIRRLRQLFSIPESKIVSFSGALEHADVGGTVIFVDDFLGSGEQFIKTWDRNSPNDIKTFNTISKRNGFKSIYINLVAVQKGLDNLKKHCPNLYVITAHILNDNSTIKGISQQRGITQLGLEMFLSKYSSRLTPVEDHISKNTDFLMKGFHEIGSLIGFDHGVPDATLPIFWSSGTEGWVPLISRN